MLYFQPNDTWNFIVWTAQKRKISHNPFGSDRYQSFFVFIKYRQAVLECKIDSFLFWIWKREVTHQTQTNNNNNVKNFTWRKNKLFFCKKCYKTVKTVTHSWNWRTGDSGREIKLTGICAWHRQARNIFLMDSKILTPKIKELFCSQFRESVIMCFRLKIRKRKRKI